MPQIKFFSKLLLFLFYPIFIKCFGGIAAFFAFAEFFKNAQLIYLCKENILSF